MALFEIPVINAPTQRLETVLSGLALTLTLTWSAWAKRWSFGVERDGVTLLQGRRIVTGTDLLSGLGLDIGPLYLIPWTADVVEPGRDELPAGDFRLIHVSA